MIHMNTNFPLVYNGYSSVLNKTYCLVVVKKPGEFFIYKANAGEAPCDSWHNYNGRHAKIFDDPKRGITFMPIGARNQLNIKIEILQGASNEKIDTLLASLSSVTVAEVDNALKAVESEN